MADKAMESYKQYRWIVRDPRLLGGALAVRDTRLSVQLVLECMANGMDLSDINTAYATNLDPSVVREILLVAAELSQPERVAVG